MRKFLFLLAALLAAPRIRAQAVEIYGTVTDAHANNVPSSALVLCPGIGCPIAYYTTTSSGNEAVEGAGVTLNFLRFPAVKLGLHLRGSRRFGTDGVDTALGGIKLTIHPPLLNIRPYIQGSFGYLGTTATDTGSATVAKSTTTAKTWP